MKALSQLSALALVAALMWAAPAAAQTTWTGSIYAGMSNVTGETSPDASWGARGNLMYQVTPVIGIGGELGYHKMASETVDILGTPTEFTGNVLQFTPEMRVRSVVGSIRPYGMGGLGMYSVKVSADPGTSETNTEFGFNLGGGIEMGNGPMTFGVEGRWHSIMTEGDATDMVSFMAGVNFH